MGGSEGHALSVPAPVWGLILKTPEMADKYVDTKPKARGTEVNLRRHYLGAFRITFYYCNILFLGETRK
jgi:hypothetical protein